MAVLVTVFCPFISKAKPPIKATLYSVLYNDPNDTQSYKTLKIIPVNNMTFGVYSDDTLNLGQYLRLYFSFSDVTSISSFHFKFHRLNTWPQDSTSSLNSVSIDLCKFNQNLTQVGYTSVRSACNTNREVYSDGTAVYEWTWAGNAVNDRNGVLVSIPFQSFMLDTSPLYFEIYDLAINGETVVYSAGDERIISILERIDDGLSELYSNAPDLSDAYENFSQNAETAISAANSSADTINNFFLQVAGQISLGQMTKNVFNPILSEFFGVNSGYFGVVLTVIGCVSLLSLFIILARRRI